jgi:hypothetical protein
MEPEVVLTKVKLVAILPEEGSGSGEGVAPKVSLVATVPEEVSTKVKLVAILP